VGGGLLRDSLFLQQGPPVVSRDSRYIIAIVMTSLVGIFSRRSVMRFTKVIALVDALALALMPLSV